MYIAMGSNVYFKHRCGEQDLRATTDNNEIATQAANMLNDAAYLSDRRRYTDSARKHAQVDALPSIKWVIPQWAIEWLDNANNK